MGSNNSKTTPNISSTSSQVRPTIVNNYSLDVAYTYSQPSSVSSTRGFDVTTNKVYTSYTLDNRQPSTSTTKLPSPLLPVSYPYSSQPTVKPRPQPTRQVSTTTTQSTDYRRPTIQPLPPPPATSCTLHTRMKLAAANSRLTLRPTTEPQKYHQFARLGSSSSSSSYGLANTTATSSAVAARPTTTTTPTNTLRIHNNPIRAIPGSVRTVAAPVVTTNNSSFNRQINDNRHLVIAADESESDGTDSNVGIGASASRHPRQRYRRRNKNNYNNNNNNNNNEINKRKSVIRGLDTTGVDNLRDFIGQLVDNWNYAAVNGQMIESVERCGGKQQQQQQNVANGGGYITLFVTAVSIAASHELLDAAAKHRRGSRMSWTIYKDHKPNARSVSVVNNRPPPPPQPESQSVYETVGQSSLSSENRDLLHNTRQQDSNITKCKSVLKGVDTTDVGNLTDFVRQLVNNWRDATVNGAMIVIVESNGNKRPVPPRLTLFITATSPGVSQALIMAAKLRGLNWTEYQVRQPSNNKNNNNNNGSNITKNNTTNNKSNNNNNNRQKTKTGNTSTGKLHCKLCLDDIPKDKCQQFTGCRHQFCTDCLAQYLDTQITDGTVHHIKCPDDQCTGSGGGGGEASYELICKLLSPKSLVRYHKLLLKKTVDVMDDMAYCPKCNDSVDIDNSRNYGYCQKCDYAFCTSCNRKYHGQQRTCTEALVDQAKHAVENRESEEFIRTHFKQCPKCRIRCEKIDGCNHMQCKMCMVHFCWLCLDDITDNDEIQQRHWRAKCKLFDYENILGY
ncbi:protein kinase 4-like [Oppia nitens]|uniref:protein kinase 4-like n=1 Tax=Oppia nitens TaxID=1686743 RepID=UPI0023DBF117|nr:protein kinase 4-like [Oppia nitens]